MDLPAGEVRAKPTHTLLKGRFLERASVFEELDSGAGWL
jgi:hypothetical protein